MSKGEHVKGRIIRVTTELIEQHNGDIKSVTARMIADKAGIGLGLINYHFGSKDKLIELCVEHLINGIIERFQMIQKNEDQLTPFEKLEYLGNMTLDFLFEHCAVSKISILTDMQTPKVHDNTHRTYAAYLPLVAACRPDWDEETIKRKTFCLITVMQQIFLRCETISRMLDIDLSQKENRSAFHARILRDILEA